MKKYYISDGKNKFGPLTQEQVFEHIGSGKISLMDYIVGDSGKEWAMIMSHPDFSSEDKGQGGKADRPKTSFGLLSTGMSDIDHTLPEALQIDEGLFMGSIDEDTRVDEIPGVVETEIEWFVKNGEEKVGPYSYLNIISLLQEGSLKEFNMVWNKDLPDWKKIAELSEFGPDALQVVQGQENQDLEKLFFRRTHERKSLGKTILIHDGQGLHKALCLEMGMGGAGIVMNEPQYPSEQTLYLKFNGNLEGNKFDAHAIVVSSCKVKVAKIPQKLIRYGLRFEQLGRDGKTFIQKLKS